MKRLLLDLLRRTAVGSVLICVAVPMLQDQVVAFTQARESGPALSVTGDVTGLTPGHPGRLLLTVHDAGDVPATISRITTAVLTSLPGCSLSVQAWTGTATVPAGGVVTESVTVRALGPRCDGATWKLAYTVS